MSKGKNLFGGGRPSSLAAFISSPFAINLNFNNTIFYLFLAIKLSVINKPKYLIINPTGLSSNKELD